MEDINMLHLTISAALQAGKAILEIYYQDVAHPTFKADQSPLTIADLKANEIICQYLSDTGLPILSEETAIAPYSERKEWQKFWMVDPLDGTKEFIKRNGEFTVNIGLIEHGVPVLGVIYAPVLNLLYYGSNETGAFKVNNASAFKTIEALHKNSQQLPLAHHKNTFKIAVSRSHLDELTEIYLLQKAKEHKMNIETIAIGSSLKMCLVAEGSVNEYPRFGPTMEWDTAAGHAIVKAAGHTLTEIDNDRELHYNKKDLHNPYFICQ